MGSRLLRSLLLAATLWAAGCFQGDDQVFVDLRGDGFSEAVVVSPIAPPPARVEEAREARLGYARQPAYWVLMNGAWVWIDGSWIRERLGYQFSPAHWTQQEDGTWRLVPGLWVPAQ